MGGTIKVNKKFKKIKIPIHSITLSFISYVDEEYEDYYVDPMVGKYGMPISENIPTQHKWIPEERHVKNIKQWEDDWKLIKEGKLIKSLKWIDNYIFKAIMTIDGMKRGRSSVKFNMKDENGVEYQMFTKGFEELVKNANINKGVVSGNWCYVKRGANHGIEYLEEEEDYDE